MAAQDGDNNTTSSTTTTTTMNDREVPTDALNNLELDSPRDEDGSESSSLTMSGQPSIISKYLQDKEREWDFDASAPRTEPLTLLELPVDVLRLIVKEITHTNDLTSLALTNSTLHNLAVPHIYTRFDIVWPDANMTASETKSVDALTYGLSTLCLGSSFARTTRRLFPKIGSGTPGPMSKFAGNDYAKYTRKFSLGNGPNDWVAEYMITKESGKMLGTLVALAIAKMVNLEAFVWDMPTGVLSDIFMALSSLPEHSASGDCNLERVWIRWHDNNDTGASSSPTTPSPHPPPLPAAVVPAGSFLNPIGISLPAGAAHPAPGPTIPYAEAQVEYPTFSVLPPLKSLTVLDVDELAYLDEMSVLIERSKDSLNELRVGISNKALHRDFAQTWDGDHLQQVDHDARWPGESTIGERRLGGILGVLLGRIYDIRRKPKTKVGPSSMLFAENGSALQTPQTAASGSTPTSIPAQPFSPAVPSPPGSASAPMPPSLDTTSVSSRRSSPLKYSRSGTATPGRKRLEGKLKLTTLELERVPLSMQVCAKAFDWPVLTNLTILECAQHENLWKLLKRQFAPTPKETGFGISPSSSRAPPNAPLQFHLNLKRIHTDITSPALISFIKETLAPNTLEILFLQDRRRGNGNSSPPPVAIDAIFKGALKRHRSSLRKLLLDSSAKAPSTTNTSSPENLRWRQWCLTTEILQYVTSGRMSSLRELAVSIDYKDWHTFLQRLPNMPQLRSLNIPNIADHIVRDFEPKELANQIADIITLRPDIQLCYLGISSKCFEILETRASDTTSAGSHGSSGPLNPVLGDNHTHAAPIIEDATDDGDNDTTDDDNDDDDDDDEDESDDDDDEGTPTAHTDPDETQSEHSEGGGDSDDDSFVEPENTRLRLREILFYDDKVAIFKARHGRL